MGALPNALSDVKPSSPGTARKTIEKHRPRGWKELHQATAAGTDYEKGVGWFPVPHDALAQVVRLSSGNLCTLLLFAILQNYGRQWCGKGKLPDESQALSIDELAILFRVTRHAVNEVLAYLAAREMAVIARIAGGRIVVKLRLPEWSGIEDDYPTWKSKQPAEAPEPEENPAVEPAAPAVQPGRVPITRKPEKVRAGHRLCRPIKCGVKEMEMVVSPNSPVDIEITAAVVSGRLVIEAIGTGEHTAKAGSIDPGKQRRAKPKTYTDEELDEIVRQSREERLAREREARRAKCQP